MSERRHPLLVTGYDGSLESRAAVAYAAERAGPSGQLVIVHATGGASAFAPDLESDEHARAVLDELMLEAGEGVLDVDFDLRVAHGSPAQALVAIAHERDADEIVVGSRGFGRVRAALGSVSHELLYVSDRPVVVVPSRNGRR